MPWLNMDCFEKYHRIAGDSSKRQIYLQEKRQNEKKITWEKFNYEQTEDD